MDNLLRIKNIIDTLNSVFGRWSSSSHWFVFNDMTTTFWQNRIVIFRNWHNKYIHVAAIRNDKVSIEISNIFRKQLRKTHRPSSPVRGHVTIHQLLHPCTEVYRVHSVSVFTVRLLFQYVGTASKAVFGI